MRTLGLFSRLASSSSRSVVSHQRLSLSRGFSESSSAFCLSRRLSFCTESKSSAAEEYPHQKKLTAAIANAFEALRRVDLNLADYRKKIEYLQQKKLTAAVVKATDSLLQADVSFAGYGKKMEDT